MLIARITTLLAMLFAACTASQPIAVTGVDAEGALVAGTNVTLHTSDADGSTIVLVQDDERIGCASVKAHERAAPVAVRMLSRATIRGRVRTPPGHTAPVRVSVVRLSNTCFWRATETFTVQEFERTWSPAARAWLPAIDAMETTAAPDGRFTLTSSEDATTVVALTSPGLAMTPHFAGSARELDVTMVPQGRIVVTVLDADSRPMRGAHVLLAEARSTCGTLEKLIPMRVAWRLQTGADGTASFDGLGAGLYFLPFQPHGSALSLIDVEVLPGRSEAVTLRPEPGVRVRGYVRDEHGRGLGGVQVSATLQVTWPAGDVRTDATGAYELRAPRSFLVLSVADVPDGLCAASKSLDLESIAIEADTHRCDFVLQRR